MSLNTSELRSGKTLVLGIGNPLMGDDGVGIQAVEMLRTHQLPGHIHLEAIATPGWELPNWLEGWHSVILIDAVQMGQTPGTWRKFQPEEVRFLASHNELSLHHSNLADGLALVEALDVLPESVTLYGVEPERVDLGSEVSPSVNACIHDLVTNILYDLGER